MEEIITKIDDKTGRPIVERCRALPHFSYQNGYTFLGTDMGKSGVKIELAHRDQGTGAIILPPNKARQCAKWLLETIGQKKPELPEELPDILHRIIKQKQFRRTLKRGEKQKLQNALKVLKSRRSQN